MNDSYLGPKLKLFSFCPKFMDMKNLVYTNNDILKLVIILSECKS